MTSRRLPLVALLAAGILLIAACSSDSSTTSSGSSSGSSGSDAAATQAALGTPKAATLPPVKVGLISSAKADSPLAANWQGVEKGVNMMVEYANAYRGGIAGHTITLDICQGGVDPSGWQTCANTLVNDNVVAVFEPFNSYASVVVPVLNGAKIPYVTLSGAALEELTTPTGVYSLVGGFPTTLGSIAIHAQQHGYKKFALIGIDVPAVSQAVQAIGDPLFQKTGVALQFIPAPVGVADMTPQMQSAISGGADAIGVIGDQTFCASFLNAHQTLGSTLPLYLVSTCIDAATVGTLGPLMDGQWMVGVSENSPDSPDGKLFGAVAETYGDNVNPDPGADGGVQTGAIVTLTLVDMLRNLTGDPTAATVQTTIDAATKTPLFLGGGSTVTCDKTAIPIFPTVCSPYVLIGTVDAQGQLNDAAVIDTAPLFKP